MSSTGLKASNLILCERLEIAQFMQVYLKHLQFSGTLLPGMQMFNFNKIERLESFLDKLVSAPDFVKVQKIFILADVGPKLNVKELEIIRAASRLNKYSNLETSYYLFPGLRKTRRWEFGYLEDALLKTIIEDTSENANYFSLRNMAEEYIFSVNNNRGKQFKFSNLSMHVLASYLAGTEKYVGMRISEAAANGAFNLNHSVFAPLRERFIKFMD